MILAVANEWTYVSVGWAISVVGLLAYVGWILRRGRALSREVPPEDRRWM